MSVSKEEREQLRGYVFSGGGFERRALFDKQGLDLAIKALPGLLDDLDAKDERIAELKAENAEWYGAAAALVELLWPYYWRSEDEELYAVNRLRRMIGWREQRGKDEGEAEIRADEVERGEGA